jgi:hypothetical protein
MLFDIFLHFRRSYASSCHSGSGTCNSLNSSLTRRTSLRYDRLRFAVSIGLDVVVYLNAVLYLCAFRVLLVLPNALPPYWPKALLASP